ncbi:GreA/GreB family elongation factor [uncultured Sphingomonas sp.]|uniref:GreA/GreB family elongation factor n=1 Tax=uncultured Sphingomonas sp. TaxID=158754 RepID=UPI0025DC310A|nr:GreA/GreB family elongation factor [uncultured Sphingomonas sp.]
MSVAFRRESDDEHKEPRFELPIPPGPNLVTERGLAQIEARVTELEALAAPDDDQKRTLRYWRQRLATAQLAPAAPVDEVGFGSRVTFRLNGAERKVHIVGEDEAEPAAGLLGVSAPLARALLGAGEGDLLPFGGKSEAIEVIGIG